MITPITSAPLPLPGGKGTPTLIHQPYPTTFKTIYSPSTRSLDMREGDLPIPFPDRTYIEESFGFCSYSFKIFRRTPRFLLIISQYMCNFIGNSCG